MNSSNKLMRLLAIPFMLLSLLSAYAQTKDSLDNHIDEISVAQDQGRFCDILTLCLKFPNDVRAQDIIGEFYLTGMPGIQRNPIEASKWLAKAAIAGSANSQFNLGMMYFNGDGVKPSDKDAVKWLSKAAMQGHHMAQFNLGWFFSNGSLETEPNLKEAKKWFKMAADQGDEEANRMAKGKTHKGGNFL